jgi:hypothetical protein
MNRGVMTDKVSNELASELARDLVASTAPQELLLFQALSRAYFRDPQGSLEVQKPRDEALGFGIGEAVTFVTPVVLAVITDVLKYLVEQVSESAKKEGAAVADEAVKRVLKKFRHVQDQPKAAPRGLGAEQVALVRRLTFERACQLKLPIEQANLLADSVVGGLVTAA